MNLIESIKSHEGFREKVYQDSLGVDTIGYGFAVKDLVITKDIADLILSNKILDLIKEVSDEFPWLATIPLDAQNIVIEMCYQLGVNGVSKFHNMIQAFKDRNWGRAADEMLDSRWATQTPKRATEMANIIRGIENKGV